MKRRIDSGQAKPPAPPQFLMPRWGRHSACPFSSCWLLLFLAVTISPALAATAVLDCGVVQEGLIQPSPLVDNSFFKIPPTVTYNFAAQTGDVILLRLYYKNEDASFRPTMTVHSPGSSIVPPRVIADKDGAIAGVGTTDFRVYDIGEPGTFSVDVQTVVGSQLSGRFRIMLVRLNRPCTAATLGCGTTLSGSVATNLDLGVFSTTVSANDVFSFRVTKTGPFDPIPGPKGPTLPPPNLITLLIFGPSGQLLKTLAGDPASVQTGNNFLSLDVRSPDSTAIRTTGTLTLLLLDQNANPMQYSISASKLTGGGCGNKPLVCGAVADGNIAAAAFTEAFTVTADAGDVFSLKLARTDTTGNFQPSAQIYDPAGKLLTTVQPSIATTHLLSTGTFVATAAGKYLVLLQDTYDRAQKGGYSVALNRLNRPCTPSGSGTLGCATVVDGKVEGVLRQNTYSFTATANDSFLIRLLRTGTGNFRPRVDIYDPQGNTVQTTTTNAQARVNFTVPTDGAYTVVVADNYDGAQSGTYTLSSLRLNRPCNAGTLDCGKVQAGSIDGALRAATYSYNAAAGESFSVRLVSPGGGLQPDIEIYDAQGQRTGTNIAGNARGVDVARPAAGTYTVVALDSSPVPGQGTFSLGLLRTRNACGTAPAQAATVTGLVSGAAPFVSYSFPVSGGDNLLVRSVSFTSGFRALMELYDGDGVRVDAGTYAVSRRSAAPGTYTAIVSADDPRAAGTFGLSWQVLNNPANAGSLLCGGTVAASLSPSSAFGYYLAGVNSGDVAKILLTAQSSGFAPVLELYDPSGARVITSGNEIQQKLASTGNYLVVVAPAAADGQSGAFTLAYQRPNNPCNAVNLTCGQSVLRQVDVAGQIDAITFNANAGDLMTVKLPVRTGTVQPFVELFNSAGSLLRGSSSGSLTLALPAGGTYNLLVRDRIGSGTGAYRVSLQTDIGCAADDKEAPSITLLTPTGGEVAAGGNPFRIAWQSDDNVDIAVHEVRLSTDGGKTFATVLAAGLSGAAQSYVWAVPATIQPTRTAQIRVTASDAAGNSTAATSDSLTIIGSGFSDNSSALVTYDSMNRITQASYGDGRTLTYSFDGSGNLVQIVVTGQ